MSKRQIRKRAASSSSSDDEDRPARPLAPVSQRKALPAVKSNSLSFGDEEQEGGEDDFITKKSKESRTIKKRMRQAPVVPAVVAVAAAVLPTDAAPSTAAVGGDYSAESLAQLRSAQKFSTVLLPSSADMDAEELQEQLSGDAAAQAENDLDGASSDGHHVDPVLQDKLRRLKAERLAEETKKKVKFSNALPKVDEREFNALDDPESARWEEELLKRAGRVGRIVAEDTPISQKRVEVASSRVEGITFKDSMSTLLGGIEKLEQSCEKNDNKLLNLKRNYGEALQEQKDLKSKVESMNEVQVWMEEFRLYCSDVVGMVREKADTIRELKGAILKVLSEDYTSVRKQRTEKQEFIVRGIQQAGQLLSLGGYLPKTEHLSNQNGIDGYNYVGCSAAADLALVARGIGKYAQTHELFVAVTEVLQRRIVPTTVEESMEGKGSRSDRLNKLRGAAELLMSDVREDIASVTSILGMFAKLRDDHPSRYRSAFISMSLPPIIGELVTLDIISLPLPFQKVDLDDRGWHEPLYQYSTTTIAAANVSSDGPSDVDDSVLLPKIVQGSVYPWVLSLLDNVFDPCSSEQSATFSDIISQLMEYDLPSGLANSLLHKILLRFEDSLKSFCFPNLRSNADIGSEKYIIFQLWEVTKCLENLLLFKALLSPSSLTKVVWGFFTTVWSGVLFSFLSFAANHHTVPSENSICELGVYVSLQLTLVVCKILPDGHKIMETLQAQKSIGDSEDQVVSATYFLQIRELLTALSPAYNNLGVRADAAVSLAQASLIMLSRLRQLLFETSESQSTCRSIENDISKFATAVRKFSVS